MSIIVVYNLPIMCIDHRVMRLNRYLRRFDLIFALCKRGTRKQ